MKRCSVVIGLILFAIWTIGVATGACAGIKANWVSGSLTVNGYSKGEQWYVNAPYLRNHDKGVLICDLSGESPRVVCAKDRGVGTKWTILPKKNGESQSSYRKEDGWTHYERAQEFQLQVAEGTYQNWYVGVDGSGEYRLTQQPKEAANFTLRSAWDYKSTAK